MGTAFQIFASVPGRSGSDRLVAECLGQDLAIEGFEQEVVALRQRGDLHPDLPSMRCVGYRQMWDYLDGLVPYDEMVYRGVAATRQLAKRQLTWLRSWQNLSWLNADLTQQENLQAVLSSLR